MITWARHEGDRFWHVIDEPACGSVPTRCNGRWPESDMPLVEVSASPPHEERCSPCQRTVVDPIEHGLAELVQHAPEDDDIDHLFDMGGEG